MIEVPCNDLGAIKAVIHQLISDQLLISDYINNLAQISLICSCSSGSQIHFLQLFFTIETNIEWFYGDVDWVSVTFFHVVVFNHSYDIQQLDSVK